MRKSLWITTRLVSIFLLSFASVLVVWTRASAAEVTITLTSAGSNDNVYDNAYAGIYNGTVTVNGVTTSALFVCDDFLDEIVPGQNWQAQVNSSNPATGDLFTPGGITNPSLTGLGLSQQQEYNMISYLVGQIFADPTNSKGQWGALSGAIWSITDGGWNPSGDYNTSYGGVTASQEVTAALAYENSPASPSFTVYTPDTPPSCTAGNCDGQEFFSPTPEPASMLLFGTGLLGIALVMRRRFQKDALL